MTNNANTIQFIDNPAALDALCEQIKDAEVIALDTEFIREKTYYPKLCLIQIATDNVVACIDPIAIKNIDKLLAIIYDQAICKVLHSASQDLEIFYHLENALPENIFDTQIAASLLGHGDQIGYANLMKAVLNIELDKGQSRTNWEQRPLSTKQISYAANDVAYLLQAYPKIKADIAKQNRTAWLTQNSQHLSQTQTYENTLEHVWQRVKHCNKLRGAQLAVLQKLAAWREQIAIEKNIPRKWVISDEVLFDVARIQPSSFDELQNIRQIEKYQNHFDTLLALVREAQALPQALWPQPKNFIKLNTEQLVQIEFITALLHIKSIEHDIAQNHLATRKDLEKLITGNQNIKLISQPMLYDIAGKDVLAFLQGEMAIRIIDNKVVLLPIER